MIEMPKSDRTSAQTGTVACDTEKGPGALLERMFARRSTPPRHLGLPGPNLDEVRLLVRAASRAPDHLQLRPFRFVAIESDEREALADVFEASEHECDPELSDETRVRARERAYHAPVLLAVILRVQQNDAVPAIEQHASAGAALGYLLLGADLLGYGAMAVSGRKMRTNVMRRAFQLSDHEELLSFVGIGTVQKKRGVPPEPDESLLQPWRPILLAEAVASGESNVD